jgi:hypothetical protein
MHHALIILGIASGVVPIKCLVSEAKSRGIRALRQVSSTPLVFTIDNFVDEELCVALRDTGDSQDARLKFALSIAGELFAGQWGPNDGLRFNQASSSDANNDVSSLSTCPEGLHVDTNNDSTFRSVTAILYLNDISPECGGATIFPLANVAEADPAFAAAQRLLGQQIAHTRGSASSSGILPAHQADARLLEARVGTSDGLRIQPEAGRLCIFFSRMDNGQIDPRSWHGGERLCPELFVDGETAIEKRILTLFKEVHYGKSHPGEYETTFESYLAPQINEQRRMLQALAQSHAQFFEE